MDTQLTLTYEEHDHQIKFHSENREDTSGEGSL
jgi:hypothetical protein